MPAGAATVTIGGTPVDDQGSFSAVAGATTVDFNALTGDTQDVVADIASYTSVDIFRCACSSTGDLLDDTTNGARAFAGDDFAIDFSRPLSYFGLYWGSPDPGNVIRIFNGSTELISFSGQDLLNRGVSGGLSGGAYVNFFAGPGESFTRVEITGTEFPFETDNHAFKVVAPTTAGTLYTYVGKPFDTFFGTGCPANCNISGWFSVPGPLAPNMPLTVVTPTAFSFTDGILTFDDSTAEAIIGVVTDADGNITGWNSQFTIEFENGTSAAIFSGTNPPGCSGCSVTDQSQDFTSRFASINGDPGSWSASTAPGPEPTVEYVHLYKIVEHVQTSDAPPVPNPRTPGPAYGGPFGFGVEIGGTNIGPTAIVAPTLSVPAGSGILAPFMAPTYNNGALVWNPQEEEWKFGWPNANNFGAPTQADIDNMFHSGAYTFRILGATVTLNLVPPPVVSQPPSFTLTGGAWSGGKYVVDVHDTLTITSNTFDGYGATGRGGFMYLDLGPIGPGASLAFVSHNYADEPEADHLTVTIPPCTLVSGQDYGARGAFLAFVDRSGEIAWAADELGTEFGIVAVGGPCGALLSLADATVTEGNTGAKNMTFAVTLDPPAAQTVTVAWSTSDGTAIAGADYTAVSGTLTFNPGVTQRTFVVPIIGDTVDEEDETFAVTLSAPVNAALGDAAGAGTIVDNDAARLRVADVSIVEGTGATSSAVFAVSLTVPSAVAVRAAYTTVDRTATAGEDFVPIAGTVTFAPGETLANVTVEIVGDANDELDEVFDLVLADPVAAAIADGSGRATVTNDDEPPLVSIDSVTVQEGTTAVLATLTVTLDRPSGKRVEVRYATAGDTATAGEDYIAKSGTVIFQPGVVTKTVTVTIRRDNKVEDVEQFPVGLFNPVNADLGTPVGTVTIIDRP
jgi:hypothetical protein